MLEKLFRKLFVKKQKNEIKVEPKPIHGKIVTQVLEKMKQKKELIKDETTEKELQ
jgi:hypothetical protein